MTPPHPSPAQGGADAMILRDWIFQGRQTPTLPLTCSINLNELFFFTEP